MKKLALFTGLTLVAGPAFAVASITMSGLVNLVIHLLIIGFICGILIWLVRKAPFIPAEWKSIIEYVIYFVAAIFVINFLLGLAGYL